jgi:hypothetical protein
VHTYNITQANVAPNLGISGQFWSGNDGIGYHYIMVEADIHLRLVLTSILDIYNLLESLVRCLKGMDAPLYHYTSKVGPRFWNLGHLWTENDAITSWLRLASTSDCFPHPYKTYKMHLRYCFAVSRVYGCTLILLY